jgi:iron complex transport system permease protein
MNQRKINILISSFFLLTCILFFLDLVLGSVVIPFKDSLKIIFGNTENESWTYILLDLRLPRAINALLTGAGLAVSGLIMQTLFRNPLAGPYVLGISSGASLGVSIYVMSLSFMTTIPGITFNLQNSWGTSYSSHFRGNSYFYSYNDYCNPGSRFGFFINCGHYVWKCNYIAG